MTVSVVIALGSNLGDRSYNLRRAIDQIGRVVRLVRMSSAHQTIPVDAPAGSPLFLNMVVCGYTSLDAGDLVQELLAIEKRLGRVRRGAKNSPRLIDLDLIVHGATRMRTPDLTLPHPRAKQRDFVMLPLSECAPTFGAFVMRVGVP